MFRYNIAIQSYNIIVCLRKHASHISCDLKFLGHIINDKQMIDQRLPRFCNQCVDCIIFFGQATIDQETFAITVFSFFAYCLSAWLKNLLLQKC